MAEPASKPESSYQIDAESVAEMARLTRQARMLSEHLGLFPTEVDLARRPHILDIGSGPGEWVMEIGRRFPTCQITGIDISERMTEYARYSAQEYEIPNTSFQVMDARSPLAFPDASFDVVHTRFVTGFLSTTTWPRLLHECFRLLKPGGIFCTTEFEELAITTSPSLARYNHLLIQAGRQAGQCFTATGDYYGITAMQQPLLQKAGFQAIKSSAHVLNYSFGMPAHEAMLDNFGTLLKLLQPFLVKCNVTTQEDIDALYSRTMQEMVASNFYAVTFFQRAWGEKPK